MCNGNINKCLCSFAVEDAEDNIVFEEGQGVSPYVL